MLPGLRFSKLIELLLVFVSVASVPGLRAVVLLHRSVSEFSPGIVANSGVIRQKVLPFVHSCYLVQLFE